MMSSFTNLSSFAGPSLPGGAFPAFRVPSRTFLQSTVPKLAIDFKLPLDFKALSHRLSELRKAFPFSTNPLSFSPASLISLPASAGLLLLTVLPLAFSFLLLLLVTGSFRDEKSPSYNRKFSKYPATTTAESDSVYFHISSLYDDGILVGITDVRLTKHERSKLKMKKRKNKKLKKGKTLEIFPTIVEEGESGDEHLLASSGSSTSSSAATSACPSFRSSFECLTYCFHPKNTMPQSRQEALTNTASFHRGLRLQKLRPRKMQLESRSEEFWEKMRVSILLALRPPLWLTFGRGGTK